MMKTLLVILFIFSASLSGALVLVPDSCISKNKSPCLVKTQSKPELVRWGKTLIWLAKDSMLELKTDNLRALQGSVWIQSSEEVPFSTSYIQGGVFAGFQRPACLVDAEKIGRAHV